MSVAAQTIVDLKRALEPLGSFTPEFLQELASALRTRVRLAKESGHISTDVSTLTQCLQPAAALILDAAAGSGLDDEELLLILWDVFAASVARTKLADKFATAVSEEAWNDVYAIVRSSMSLDSAPKYAMLSYFAILKLFTATSLITSLFNMLELSGRARLGLALLTTISWATTGAWLLYGFDIGGQVKTVVNIAQANPDPELDAASVSSASAEIRKENERLRLEVEALRATDGQDPGPPPAGAPPLPGGPKEPGLNATAVKFFPDAEVVKALMEVGARGHLRMKRAVVVLQSISSALDLNGQVGTITALLPNGLYVVRLRSGASARGLSEGQVALHVEHEVCPDCLDALTGGAIHVCDERPPAPPGLPPAPPPQGASSQDAFHDEHIYAPFAKSPPTEIKAQAGRLKEALIAAFALVGAIPDWPVKFWQAVAREDALYGIKTDLLKVLVAHGYVCEATITAPRTGSLKKELSCWVVHRMARPLVYLARSTTELPSPTRKR